MRIRKLQREDKESVHTILFEVDVFKTEELDVARELIDVFLDEPEQKDYEMYTCIGDANDVLGYLCVGPTPIAAGTFDLYWIVVRRSAQHHSVGKQLLDFTEELIRSKGGRLLIAETSSQRKYTSARTFYRHNGFTEVAHIQDYYDVGDDLVIYAKNLRQ